eukprot:6220654-Amphidinium_carterae.1
MEGTRAGRSQTPSTTTARQKSRSGRTLPKTTRASGPRLGRVALASPNGGRSLHFWAASEQRCTA